MKIKNKYITVFIYTLSTLVFFLPQLSTFYYVVFLDAYNLTNAQAGTLLSVYGMTSLPAYLFGGLLADKFKAKNLIVISCFATGTLGIIMTFVSSYYILLGIYVVLGLTTTFLQWSALCKIVRSLGTEQEQGKLYGTMEMSNSIIGAVCLYGILAALGLILEAVGFKVVTSIFGVLLFISGILIMLFCNDPSAGIKDNDFNFKSVVSALKHPVVWINGFIVMGIYLMNTASTYLSPYMSEVIGVPMTIAVGIQITASYILSAFLTPVGGAIIDKSGKTPPLLLVTCAGVIACMASIIFVGINASIGLIIAIIVAFYVVLNLQRTCMYTPIPEGGVPLAITGTATGIVSTIGYSSDIWMYTLCGSWLDKYGEAGYSRIWGLIIVAMLVSAVFGLLFARYKKKNREKIEAVYRENEMLGTQEA